MSMFNVTVSLPANAKGAAILASILETIGDDGKAAKVPSDRNPRGRPKKDAAPVADDEMDFGVDAPDDEAPEESDDEETADEDETEDADEAEEEAPVAKKRGRPAKATIAAAEPTKATKGLTLEGNIIPAFQKFADKHSREKAGKVLTKYGVKSVRDLPKEKYPEILKLLKV